jgi:phosphoribosylformylglycinamidine (FGAM) synthase-like amidotransferase family enzyme
MPTKKTEDMNFEELKDYTKNMKQKKSAYISKYQKTDKGKATIKVATGKYYAKHREKILIKKREYYALKKANKLKVSP